MKLTLLFLFSMLSYFSFCQVSFDIDSRIENTSKEELVYNAENIKWDLSKEEIRSLIEENVVITYFDNKNRDLTFSEIKKKKFKKKKPPFSHQAILWNKFMFSPKYKSTFFTIFIGITDRSKVYIPYHNQRYFVIKNGILRENTTIKTDIRQTSVARVHFDSIDFSRPFFIEKEAITRYGKYWYFQDPRVSQKVNIHEINTMVDQVTFSKDFSIYTLIIFVSFIFFLISYLVSKDSNFLNYSLYLLATCLIFLPVIPFGYNILNYINPNLFKYVGNFGIAAASGFYLFFAMRFLEVHKDYPKIYRISIWAFRSIHVYFIIYSVIIFFDEYSAYRFALPIIFKTIFAVFSVVLFIVLLSKKNTTLIFKIVLIGSLLLILGNILSIIFNYAIYFLSTVLLEIIIYIGIVSYTNKKNTIDKLKTLFQYEKANKEKEHLSKLNEMKTQFFEDISHEFRTPLTLIKLPLSQAIKNNKELDLSELNLIHNNASRLQNLIEDLLSLSELEVGKMKINKSEQDPLVQVKNLCLQFDSYAESKGINYHKVIERNSINATYDKSAVDKVLRNLISNAIKYSETGGEVQVSVSIVEHKLVMKVSDKGEGISTEDQEKIFERFYRVGDYDEGKQGSGIGLALVKKLIEINNGTIDVTSKIKEGSTFTATIPLENIVQLPYEPQPEKPISEKRTKPKEDLLDVSELSDKPKLLITEDSKELLEYISNLFKDDFQLINAMDGEEGMKKALEYVPDFIISDWMMPNKNGIEFCKDIKTNAITSHIPFLLLTAKSTAEDKIEGYETGADAYFPKPFNFIELRSRVTSLLKQRQLLYDKFKNSEISLNSPTTNSLDVKFWKEFKQVLKENIRESNITASSFADNLGMSRMQLHRKLVALTGQNLSTIIKNS